MASPYLSGPSDSPTTPSGYGAATGRWTRRLLTAGAKKRRLSDNELEVVFKNGWKPSEYVASRDG